jgi:hypothetical protein
MRDMAQCPACSGLIRAEFALRCPFCGVSLSASETHTAAEFLTGHTSSPADSARVFRGADRPCSVRSGTCVRRALSRRQPARTWSNGRGLPCRRLGVGTAGGAQAPHRPRTAARGRTCRIDLTQFLHSSQFACSCTHGYSSISVYAPVAGTCRLGCSTDHRVYSDLLNRRLHCRSALRNRPGTRADADQIAPTEFRSSTSRNIDVRRRVPQSKL